jgi:hypothetical protein
MKNESYLANLQEFKKGQNDGITGTMQVITKIIDGTDKGTNALKNRELEKVRRVLLMWRDHIIETKKDPKAMAVLVETKKIMDIQIPNNLK